MMHKNMLRSSLIALAIAASPIVAQGQFPSPPVPGPYPLMPIMIPFEPIELSAPPAALQRPPAPPLSAMRVPYWMQHPSATPSDTGAATTGVTTTAPSQAAAPGGATTLTAPVADATTRPAQPYGQVTAPGYFPAVRGAPTTTQSGSARQPTWPQNLAGQPGTGQPNQRQGFSGQPNAPQQGGWGWGAPQPGWGGPGWGAPGWGSGWGGPGWGAPQGTGTTR